MGYIAIFCKYATLEQALSIHPNLFASGFFDTDVHIPDKHGYVRADFIDADYK